MKRIAVMSSGFFGKMAEKSPEKYPSRMGKAWGQEEIKQLLTEVKQKRSINDIANIHQRTTGGIRARLKQIAADEYFNNNLSIDQCQELTGLNKEAIIDAIARRELQTEKKKPPAVKKESVISTHSFIESPQESQPELKEILEILKDIQTVMHDYINKRYRRIIIEK